MSSLPVGKKCMVVGCNDFVRARDMCNMHYVRWQRHGHTNDPSNEKRKCTIEGCDNEHAAKGLCANHYYNKKRTGSVHGLPKTVSRCSVENCDRPYVAAGFCEVHYRRTKRHGHLESVRPADWGSREKHPLYSTWIHIKRHYERVLCQEWGDFWTFVSDVVERPSDKYVLNRIDETDTFNPNNVYWRMPRVSTNSEDAKEQAKIYMREWRRSNLDRAINSEMRKRYGITLDDYNGMFADQGGVCVICQKAETRVDHRTKTISRLAVDHDHNTGKIRGLLCHACNVALGLFKDDKQLMRRASEYLHHSLDEPDNPHPT